MKEITICGSSGFAGSEIIKRKSEEYRFRKLERKDLYDRRMKLAEKINGNDVVLHLAGLSIVGHINRKVKGKFLNSWIVKT